MSLCVVEEEREIRKREEKGAKYSGVLGSRTERTTKLRHGRRELALMLDLARSLLKYIRKQYNLQVM